ncbi:MAG: CBS domain-containing protein [Ferruginibacter sp.]
MNKNTHLSEIMTTNLVVANKNNSLSQLAQFFTNFGVHHIPVTDGSVPIGIVSVSDLVRFISAKMTENKFLSLTTLEQDFKIESIMTNVVFTLSKNDTVKKALETLSESGFQSLLITENGNLVGLVTLKDLVRFTNNNW